MNTSCGSAALSAQATESTRSIAGGATRSARPEGEMAVNRGPLRAIVRLISCHGDYDRVELSCGHMGRSYGGVKARCPRCEPHGLPRLERPRG